MEQSILLGSNVLVVREVTLVVGALLLVQNGLFVSRRYWLRKGSMLPSGNRVMPILTLPSDCSQFFGVNGSVLKFLHETVLWVFQKPVLISILHEYLFLIEISFQFLLHFHIIILFHLLFQVFQCHYSALSSLFIVDFRCLHFY